MQKALYELKPGTIIELINGNTSSCKLVVTDRIVCYKDYHPDMTWRILVDINTGDTIEWAITAQLLPEHWQIYKLPGNNI